MEGSVNRKWGSLLKMGYPEAVFLPLTAQLLLPMPSGTGNGCMLLATLGTKRVSGRLTGTRSKSHTRLAGIMGSNRS